MKKHTDNGKDGPEMISLPSNTSVYSTELAAGMIGVTRNTLKAWASKAGTNDIPLEARPLLRINGDVPAYVPSQIEALRRWRARCKRPHCSQNT